jgi:hypothetical protein
MSLMRTGTRYPAKPKAQVTAGRTVFGFLVAVLLVASGLMWAVMFFGPLAHLARLASGLTPFDIRPKGYSYAEARAFLAALGEQGRAYYASPELIIDTFYPPLYAVSRGLALWWLTMPGRLREVPVPLKVLYALIAVPILISRRTHCEAAGTLQRETHCDVRHRTLTRAVLSENQGVRAL